MDARNRGAYEIENRELVAEGSDLRVQVLTLAPGQSVPWHYHTEITDSFVCLEGLAVIETKAPGKTTKLMPGQRYAVAPNTAHTVYVSGDARVKIMVIQGVGVYDFKPVGEFKPVGSDAHQDDHGKDGHKF